MANQEKAQVVGRLGRVLWHGAKQAAMSLLFTIVLVIPRVRRVRRKARAWITIRLAEMLVGACLVWRFSRGNAGVVQLVCGLALIASGLLVAARPEMRPVDALARDLNALVVLNGGTFISAIPAAEGKGEPGRDARIFVNPERLLVLGGHDRSLAEIPLAAVRHLAVRPVLVEPRTASEGKPWHLEITWQSSNLQTATFRFGGFFAEHLARVAETTLRNLLKNDLPVLRDDAKRSSQSWR